MASTTFRDFKLAVDEPTPERDEEVAEFIEFTIEAKGPYRMYLPTTSQLALLMAAHADGDEQETTVGLLKFMEGVFDPASYRALRKRFNDRTDPLDLMKLMEIVTELVKEWTGFPTKPLSDSPPSPSKTGARSTGRVPGKGSTLSS